MTKKMVFNTFLALVLLGSSNVNAVATEVMVQELNVCDRQSSLPPSTTTRTISFEGTNISFEVPENYRVEVSQSDEIDFLLYNPADDNVLECCTRARVRGCGHQTKPISVSMTPATNESSLIPEFENNGSFKKPEIRDLQEITVAGQQGVIYALYKYGGGTDKAFLTREINFFSPDGKYLVSLSFWEGFETDGNSIDAVDERVLRQIANSFFFGL